MQLFANDALACIDTLLEQAQSPDAVQRQVQFASGSAQTGIAGVSLRQGQAQVKLPKHGGADV